MNTVPTVAAYMPLVDTGCSQASVVRVHFPSTGSAARLGTGIESAQWCSVRRQYCRCPYPRCDDVSETTVSGYMQGRKPHQQSVQANETWSTRLRLICLSVSRLFPLRQLRSLHAKVAQLVELRPIKPTVAGSSPVFAKFSCSTRRKYLLLLEASSHRGLGQDSR